jgi:hypothetical protein
MPGDVIKISENVTVKLVDRKTGKVMKEISGKNSIGSDLAQMILKRIFANSVEEGFDAPTVVRIYDYDGNSIKDIFGTWTGIYQYENTFRRKLTATDSSSDEYTFFTLHLRTQSLDYSYCSKGFMWPGVGKPREFSLVVEWTVIISYDF